MVERKAFLAYPKHPYRASQYREHDCSAITKRMEIIISIQFALFDRWILIIQKMVERKAFLANPKH